MKITRRQLKELVLDMLSESTDRSYSLELEESPMPLQSLADPEFAKIVKGTINEHEGHSGDHASIDARHRWMLSTTENIANERGREISRALQGMRSDVAGLLGDLESHLPGHSPDYQTLLRYVVNRDSFPKILEAFSPEISIQEGYEEQDSASIANPQEDE